MTMGEKLQLLRKSRGLSQEQLAAELDVSRQAISKWECGDSTPDLDKLRAICTYFGVTADYLIWEKQKMRPPTRRLPRPVRRSQEARKSGRGSVPLCAGTAIGPAISPRSSAAQCCYAR